MIAFVRGLCSYEILSKIFDSVWMLSINCLCDSWMGPFDSDSVVCHGMK